MGGRGGGSRPAVMASLGVVFVCLVEVACGGTAERASNVPRPSVDAVVTSTSTVVPPAASATSSSSAESAPPPESPPSAAGPVELGRALLPEDGDPTGFTIDVARSTFEPEAAEPPAGGDKTCGETPNPPDDVTVGRLVSAWIVAEDRTPSGPVTVMELSAGTPGRYVEAARAAIEACAGRREVASPGRATRSVTTTMLSVPMLGQGSVAFRAETLAGTVDADDPPKSFALAQVIGWSGPFVVFIALNNNLSTPEEVVDLDAQLGMIIEAMNRRLGSASPN